MAASLIFLFISGIYSCAKIDYFEPIEVEEKSSEPVYFADYEEIKERGTIRMITRYNSTSYFLLDGMDRGFEFELVSRFARENGLKVEVVLIGYDEDPIDILNKGEGDIIADHFEITNERLDRVQFSKPYNFIDQLSETGEHQVDHISLIGVADDGVGLEVLGGEQYETVAYYIGRITPGIIVVKSDTLAWATRKNASVLKQKMDEFMEKHLQIRESDGRILRSAYLNNLNRRYFKTDRLESRYGDRAYDTIYSGYLSPYDDMVRSIADEAGVDWKLVIAVMAQESAFDPGAESLAGALGLMQIIPRFSQVKNKSHLFDPEINIREGVRYLKKHLTREAHLDSLNQHSFALAAYNVGMGNLADARELAVQLGNEPDEWRNIADALLKLMDPEYYQHARFGYKRGTETVNYVEDVLNRYSRYQAIHSFSTTFNEQHNNGENIVMLSR